MKEKGKSRSLIVIAIVLVLIIGVTYAWLTLTLGGTKTNVIRAGILDLTLDDTTSEGILLEKAIPMFDKKGLETTAYTFTVKNNGTNKVNYTLYLDDEALETDEVRMNDKYVKYSLIKNDEEVAKELLTEIGENPDRVLDSGIIDGGDTNSYTLRVWIDKDADNDVMGTIFYARLRLVAEQTAKTENESVTYNYTNENIKAAYKYDVTNCITGEEDICT